MITILSVICSILLIGCITLGICLHRASSNVFRVARKHVNSLYTNHKNVRNELIKKKNELSKKEIKLDSNYDKLKNDLLKKEEALKNEYDKKREHLKKEFEEKQKELENDVEEALKDAEEALEENVASVDEILENKLIEIKSKNTRMFNCLCSDKPIPCFIDLTSENTYRCGECGSVYRVEITMNPILIGKAISDEDYVSIIASKMEEEENNFYEKQ